MGTVEPPAYPKGDLRRMLSVLAAIATLNDATQLRIAARTGLDKRTVLTLINMARTQAGVSIVKDGPIYRLTDWGPVISPIGAAMALVGGRAELGDGLLDYMASADETARHLCAGGDPLVKVLLQYEAYFRHDLWEHCPPKPTFAFVLYLNAYQMFLAGARMALSGHPAAVFPLLRTALESASYGYLMEQQPGLAEVWGNRHRNDDDKKACRHAFTFEKAIKGLDAKALDLHRLAKEVYESSIDYGAHPNVRGVFGHVSIDETRPDGLVALTHTSLYGSTHHETIRGICACLDFGFAIIGIILLIAPDVTEQLVADLDRLNSAKETAIAKFQSM